ncbi:hypothetical protein TGME49_219500 [Toxoplasma gondii ME49]|uniref:Apicomplexan specific, related protein n=1 Tax=Toxoplasma gondii (strain ATCC 50611 / Me49) TaxID=508771 RepID=S8FZF3_TOXGM|nr:hypothetical protein TGME49_219500 [Toxoplasma gondii ME49]EPT24605.1 hypothetical protein TGME49_219500 [Toxoplasma gondii ME49]|eukprot:XP_018634798.1 hypothetical protein TGME49_219500 [Toxoplasma gondii ME49]
MASSALLTIHPSSATQVPHCASCEFRPRARRGGEEEEYEPSLWAALLAKEAEQWEGEDDLTLPQRGQILTEKAREKLCNSQRCRTWLDLRLWFGFEEPDLCEGDYEEVFRPVRHEGFGLFEHFVELGSKTLETLTEMFFFRHYSLYARGASAGQSSSEFVAPAPLPLPPDLRKRFSPSVPQLLYTQKHTERTCAPISLYRFALAYLAGAQGLKTRTSVVEYVRACIGYACCCAGNSDKSLYVWGSVLIEHIYWTQRITSGHTHDESMLIHDLQEYLGYKYSSLRTKILRALDGSEDARDVDAPPGDRVLRVYLEDFFKHLAEDSGVDPDNMGTWISREVNHFYASPALALFASVCFSLTPFLAELGSSASLQEGDSVPNLWSDLPPSTTYVSAFLALLSACWREDTEDSAKVWMKALVRRLRQLQLVVEIVGLEAKNPRRRQGGAQVVDVRRLEAFQQGLLGKYLLWVSAFEEEDAGREKEERAALEAVRRLLPTQEALALFASEHPLGSPCGGFCAPVSRFLGALGLTEGGRGRRPTHTAFPRSYGLPTSRGVWTIQDAQGRSRYEMIFAGGPVQPAGLQSAMERCGDVRGRPPRARPRRKDAKTSLASLSCPAPSNPDFFSAMPFS